MAPDLVFTSKKSGVLVGFTSAAMTTIIAQLGYVFSLFPLQNACFFHFSHRPTSWSSPCLRCCFPKESSCSWMDGLGMVKVYWEPKGCVKAQCLGFFLPRQGLNVNLKKTMNKRTAWWVKISSCRLILGCIFM